MSDKNIFEALRQWRLIQTVEHDGIGEAAKDEDIPKSEVNEIVLKAIQDHQDVIKSHQHSIASLQKCMEDEEKKDHPTMEPKSSGGSSSSQGGGDVLCYICGKNGHKAKDCCGIGCYKCGKLGHSNRGVLRCDGGWDFERLGLIGTYDAICYYCGKAGYIPVCSMCGETGHVGKECW